MKKSWHNLNNVREWTSKELPCHPYLGLDKI